MRFPKRRIASLASLSLLALVWSGCEAKQQSEYVAGVSTQVKVPRDLKYIRLSVSVGGVSTFCRAYKVYDGIVQLPRSLGTHALNEPSGEPITYQVTGYTEDLQIGEELNDIACGDKVGQNGARILRRSRQPYVKDQTLFLPMPLKYSCYDTNCDGDDKTCKGGRCVGSTVTDLKSLPTYTPDLVDGSGSTCFSIQFCMGAALPAIPVNLDDCTYATPNTPSAPPTIEGLPNPYQQPPGTPSAGEGVNVEVTYDGGYVREVLDKDPDEGFTIPDPAKPQQFRLAPGLCEMVKGNVQNSTKRITAVRVSPTCRPKTLSQPICQNDALTQMGLDPNGFSPDDAAPAGCSSTELKPPKTGLVVVIDNTKEHEKFLNGADVKFALDALRDPAFYRAEIAVVYTSGPLNQCPMVNSSVAVPLTPAGAVIKPVQDSIEAQRTLVAGKTLGTETPRFDAGLQLAYDTLKADGKDYFRRAVMALGDGDFGGNTCVQPGDVATQGTVARAGAAKNDATKSIQTYVFDLNGNSGDPPSAQADAIAAAGGTVQSVNAPGTDKAPAKDGFQQVVEYLATCVYDAPTATVLPNDGTLSYNDPAFPSIPKTINPDPTCNETTTATANGWGRGTNDGKLYICGAACTDYRSTLKNAALLTFPFGQPPPAMPIFGHQKGCGPK